MRQVTVLGISAYYHDSAAAIVRGGVIAAAAQEERFTRKKGDSSFPVNAVSFCLSQCGIGIEDVDYIVYYEEPMLKFERILESYSLTVPKSVSQYIRAMPEWLTDKLWMRRDIRKKLGTDKDILFCDHHISHAASAFLPSPFDRAAILTIDGVGEWATASLGVGEGKDVKLLRELRYPNSLGLLYSAFTFYCGFRINSGEYKLMGLAPYGEPVWAEVIKQKLVHICDDGSIVLNQKYFDYTFGMRTINRAFEDLFGGPARRPEEPIDKRVTDVAASIQAVTDEIVIRMARYLKKLTGLEDLVMAGGVALNVTANGALLRSGIFKNIWIQPAAGDAGGALGAALYCYYSLADTVRKTNGRDAMNGALLGPGINYAGIPRDKRYPFRELDEKTAVHTVARLLSEGRIAAVAVGRMEYGPRALGSRSILADPRDPAMQKALNLNIKFREDFRPFAPCVLREDADKYFEINGDSPYMLFTYYVLPGRRLPFTKTASIPETIAAVRSDIPAVTHIDYSARVQTVTKESSPFLYEVLCEFKKLTGCSVLVNTSFNVRGEPIVCTGADAYNCFVNTNIDAVLIGGRLYEKAPGAPKVKAPAPAGKKGKGGRDLD